VQEEEHFLTVCRYVERNPLRARLVSRAEQWRWSSLWRWHEGTAAQKRLLSAWPVRRAANWLQHVNAPQTEAELSALRRSVTRGCPFGEEHWSNQMVKKLQLESTIRPQGRPKKKNGS
jgi:putative transposase